MSFRQMNASEEVFSLYAEKVENVMSFKYLTIILDHRLFFVEYCNYFQKNHPVHYCFIVWEIS